MRPTNQSGTYRAYNPAWPQVPPAPWRAGRGALLLYTLAIIYASLNPFVGWRVPPFFPLFIWPKYLTAFDITLNIFAYVPLGVLLATWFVALIRRRQQRLHGHYPQTVAWQAWLLALLAAGALSAAMESLQAFLPSRVCSSADWLANAFGAMLGATFIVTTPGRIVLENVERWRYRHFAAGNWVDWGLLLLGLWLFAQLNSAIPFFEAGNVISGIGNQLAAGEKPHPYDPLFLLPQAVGIALNVCGFALFITLLLHPAKPVWLNVAIVLLLGFVAKVSMASLMLKAPLLIAWMGPGTVIGLTTGLLLAAGFSRLHERWRVLSATLFVFAGGVMSKISSVYTAFSETLRLFDWPYGQLVNFASLTRWLSEIWPLIAFIFCAIVFIRQQRSA